MLLLSDIRDLIASFNIVSSSNVYSGKLDNKKDRSIGVYHRKDNKVHNTLGGDVTKVYDIKPISLLIHYNKSQVQTEKKAIELFEKLKEIRNVTINDKKIYFINVLMNEPQSVDTDDTGIYEYVIWIDIVYERG